MGLTFQSPIIPEGTYDYGMIQLRMANGGTAYYEATWSATTASENVKEFVGTKGRIRLVLQDYRVDNKEEGNLIEHYDLETGEYRSINVPGKYKDMYAQICTLIDMIENGHPGNPTLEDAMTAFRLVTECDRIIRKQLSLS